MFVAGVVPIEAGQPTLDFFPDFGRVAVPEFDPRAVASSLFRLAGQLEAP